MILFFSLYGAMIKKNKVLTIVKMFEKVNYGLFFVCLFWKGAPLVRAKGGVPL